MSHDKSKMVSVPHHDLLGTKPAGTIGPSRTQAETKVVGKLKAKKVAKNTFKQSQKANVGEASRAISALVNR